MTFTTSPASAADADAVGEIHAESWRAANAPFFAPRFFADALRHRRTKWHDVLASEDKNTVLLAFLDGRPLAFSYFGPSAAHPGSVEIYGFYGHPDGWGSGIASALMTATLDRIRADGFGHVHLWTLRDTPQSRRFYTKSGFTESGTVRTHDYGDGNPLPQVEYELRFPA
ncbi:GCN5-related N-acetyltransferase [[Actinomadura] parvosata subsp. kistnae]|uniref:GNAT family N-acetyltransferase n=1 Tax=[Actinomadura] parvosata subsp. kistnae TaxID=1909395 RepID=A0A1V0A5P7_9ACTN|nr:GNAT family N-acetyltransferase [Nonomuraea sp. ATCC 55076]AQZ65489.1 GNAT family N-acetyltransferase [Nonomuraea sp. ATCC 55076]SPL96837.1 GCN5-related N-acetyltransferase [Actinomadura parvosata subsp. kistnae]